MAAPDQSPRAGIKPAPAQSKRVGARTNSAQSNAAGQSHPAKRTRRGWFLINPEFRIRPQRTSRMQARLSVSNRMKDETVALAYSDIDNWGTNDKLYNVILVRKHKMRVH